MTTIIGDNLSVAFMGRNALGERSVCENGPEKREKAWGPCIKGERRQKGVRSL